ncbi:Serine acetyltransferase [compost metagenome]
MSLLAALRQLKRYWCIEILGSESKSFSWLRVRQKCKRSNRYAYLFWFRIAYVMNQSRSSFWRRRAKLLNERLSRRFNVEIMLGAEVGEGLWIAHPTGIVISAYARIGSNFRIWQNCTVGIKGGEGQKIIRIGNNVRLSAHSCIIGDVIRIGDNVTIGAMSFVNRDIPDDCLYYTRKTGESLSRNAEPSVAA